MRVCSVLGRWRPMGGFTVQVTMQHSVTEPDRSLIEKPSQTPQNRVAQFQPKACASPRITLFCSLVGFCIDA